MIRFAIRGATPDDEPHLLALARHLNTVNLPDDPAAVREILEHSARSFSGELADARKREYVFVIEDVASGRVAGTSKVIAQLGQRDAPYIYLDVLTEERYSPTVDRHFVHTLLRLGHSYDGPTEIGGLVVLPEFRRAEDKIGMMISYVRFAFMATHRPLMRDEVVAELLPPLEPDGTSHLWEAFGRKFTDMSYSEADRLSKRNKEFVKSLFPSGDVYASLLPRDAQAVIGKVGRETRGVEKLLRRIGFAYCNRIDPFDGGPHFRAPTDDILLVRRTRVGAARALDAEPEAAPKSLVCVDLERAPYFRAVATPARVADDGAVELSREALDALTVTDGATVAALPLD